MAKELLVNALGISKETNVAQDIINGAKKILNLSSNTLIVIYMILSIICMISYGFLTDVSGTTLTGVYVGCVLACLGIVIAGTLRIMYSDSPKAKSILNVILIILFLFQTGLNITMIAFVSTSEEAGRLTKNMKFVSYLSGIAPLIIAPSMIYSFYNSAKYLEKLDVYVKNCDKPASAPAPVVSSVPVVAPSASSASSQLLAQIKNDQIAQASKDAECNALVELAKSIQPLTKDSYESLIRVQAQNKGLTPIAYSVEAATCLNKHGIQQQVSVPNKPFLPEKPYIPS
jgi:hypothetical protein